MELDKAEPSPRMSRAEKHRVNVLNEILSTERTYVHNLITVVQVYIKPIRAKALSPDSIITVSDFSRIFSNWEVILNLHSAILKELDEDGSSPARIFSSYLQYFAVYTLYVNNYGRALSTFNRVSQIPRVQAFLKQCKNHLMSNHLDLASFLIMPVQRVPRYNLLFRDLLKHTDKEHKDYDVLADTLEQIEKIAVNINERKREAEQLDRVVAVAEMFHPEVRSNELSELVQEHRKVIREGPLYRISRRHAGKKLERHGILFNDLLLITSWRGHNQLELHSFHALSFVTLRDLSDGSSVRYAFSVDIDDHPDGGITVSFPSPEEKEGWMNDLKHWISDCQDREFAKTGELFAWDYGSAQDYYAESRFAHTLTSVGDSVILFGGTDLDENVYSDLYMLDTTTNQWSAPVFDGPQASPRFYHSTVAMGDPTAYDSQVLVFGGYDGTNRLNDLWMLDMTLMSWTYVDVGENTPAPRSAHSAVSMGNKMYVFGGRGANGSFLSDLVIFDADSKTWSWPNVIGASPEPRAWHSANAVGNDIYIFGGYATNKTYNDMWILDTVNLEWRCISTGVAGRYAHSAVLIGRRLFVAGGAHSGVDFSDDLAVFDTDSNLWSYPRLRTSTGPVAFHAMAAVANRIVVFGGKTDMSTMTTGDPLYLNARAMSVGEMFGELRWQAEGKIAKTKLMADHGDASEPLMEQWATALHKREEEEIKNAEAAALAMAKAKPVAEEEEEEEDLRELRRVQSEYQKPLPKGILPTSRTKSAKLFVSPDIEKKLGGRGQKKGVFSTIKKRLTTKEQPGREEITTQEPEPVEDVKDSRRVTIDERKRITFEDELSKALKRRTTKPPSSDLRQLSTEIAEFDKKKATEEKEQNKETAWPPSFKGGKIPLAKVKEEDKAEEARPPSVIIRTEEEIQKEKEINEKPPVSPKAEPERIEKRMPEGKPLTMAEKMKREHRFRPGSRMPSQVPPQIRPIRGHQRMLSKVTVPPSSGTVLSQKHLDLSHLPASSSLHGRTSCPSEVEAKLYRGDDVRVVTLNLLSPHTISPTHGSTRPMVHSVDEESKPLVRSPSGQSSYSPRADPTTLRQRVFSEGHDDTGPEIIAQIQAPSIATPPRLTPPVPLIDKSPAARLRKQQHRRSVSYAGAAVASEKKIAQIQNENNICSIAVLIARIRAEYSDIDGVGAMAEDVLFKLRFKDEEGDMRKLSTRKDLWGALVSMLKQRDKYLRLWVERVDDQTNVPLPPPTQLTWRGEDVAKAYLDSVDFLRTDWPLDSCQVLPDESLNRFKALNINTSKWNATTGLGVFFESHDLVARLIDSTIQSKECTVWRHTALPIPSTETKSLASLVIDYCVSTSISTSSVLPQPPLRCVVVVGEQGQARGDVEPTLISAMLSSASINNDSEPVFGVAVWNNEFQFMKLLGQQKTGPPKKDLPAPPTKSTRPSRRSSIGITSKRKICQSEPIHCSKHGDLLRYWGEII